MKNIEKVKAVKAERLRTYLKQPAFRLGYLDAYYNAPFSKSYDNMIFRDQLAYENGRLVAKALLVIGLAPMWRPQVQCPRDLPRLVQEYIQGVVPRSQRRQK